MSNNNNFIYNVFQFVDLSQLYVNYAITSIVSPTWYLFPSAIYGWN